MAANRITTGGAVRRALLAAALLVGVAALSACGSGGETTTAVPDKAGDVDVLNGVLSRQLGAVEAYGRSIPALRGQALATAREFRASEQEHVDAIVKALRGLGGEAEAEPERIEASGLRTQPAALEFLYELEGASIDFGLAAIAKLTAPWPRSLLASIAANQAQHLVVLRRLLGAGPLEAVPEAFEDGTTPVPGTAPPGKG